VKRALWVAALAAALVAGCTSGSGISLAGVVGLNDMVLVDDLPTDGGVAREPSWPPDGGTASPDPGDGIPNRYVFLTSTDTNELKVLNLYRPGYLARSFELAPNPLEALAIPVLDRPSVLACDEGLSPEGRRVTGPFVYAVRPGGAQLSVVDATPLGFSQVTRYPLATPAPLTAIVAWMGDQLTTLPRTTTVYYATWDGSTGSLWALTLNTDPAQRHTVTAARPRHLIDVGPEAVVALKAIPPLATRTLDGVPFCAGPASCLAIATRSLHGTQGRSLLLQLDTLRAAPLAFPGPVRSFANSGLGVPLVAALDEEGCATGCGGVIAVDTRAGSSSTGFPVLSDFTGQAMLPVKYAGALPRDITVAKMSTRVADPLALTWVAEQVDGGVRTSFLARNRYAELALVTTSAGAIYPLDTEAGAAVDFDGVRATLTPGSLTIPSTGDDGGVTYEVIPASIAEVLLPDGGLSDEPYRDFVVAADGGSVAGDAGFSLTLGDGYLFSQTITVVRNGAIAGLVLGASDGGTLVTFAEGLEARLMLRDSVSFSRQVTLADGTVGTQACGQASIVELGPGRATVDHPPVDCVAAVAADGGTTSFTVSAGPDESVVVTGSLEGHMGRLAEGETLTYTRRLLARPRGWSEPAVLPDGGLPPGQSVGPRPAFTLRLGSIPSASGSGFAFGISGHLQIYRFTFDANTVGCSPYLPGRVQVAPIPRYFSETSTLYPWTLLTAYPGSNGLIYSPLQGIIDYSLGTVSSSDGAICYR
jgi:hypothetical protein